MNVIVTGKLLAIRTGKNKNTGKEYTVADVYDGFNLIKVYGVDVSSYTVDQNVSISAKINVDYDNRSIFVTAIR